MTEVHEVSLDDGTVVREFEVKPPSTSALISLPAVYVNSRRWGGLHCTMAYIRDVNGPFFEDTGTEEISKESILNALRTEHLNGKMWGHDFYRLVNVYSVDVFDGEVPVLKIGMEREPVQRRHIICSQLDTLHDGVTGMLKRAGIRYETDYAGENYSPHVSVDLRTALRPPKQLLLTPMELWYKNDEPVVV